MTPSVTDSVDVTMVTEVTKRVSTSPCCERVRKEVVVHLLHRGLEIILLEIGKIAKEVRARAYLLPAHDATVERTDSTIHWVDGMLLIACNSSTWLQGNTDAKTPSSVVPRMIYRIRIVEQPLAE